MKRRDFLTYSLLTGGSSLLLPLVTACQKGNFRTWNDAGYPANRRS